MSSENITAVPSAYLLWPDEEEDVDFISYAVAGMKRPRIDLYATYSDKRDYNEPGSGRPDFIEWCFHAPWFEPEQPLPTRDDGRREFRHIYDWLEYRGERRAITNTTTTVGREKESRWRTLDPRYAGVRKRLRYHPLYRNNDIPVYEGTLCAAISVLTLKLRTYGGFLAAKDVVEFIDFWWKQSRSSDMLRLLSYVPRSSWTNGGYSRLRYALRRVIHRFVDENIEDAGIGRDSLRPKLSINTELNKAVTFFGKGTGRIWLCLPAPTYYQEVASLLVETQQLHAVPRTRVEVSFDRPLMTSYDRMNHAEKKRAAELRSAETKLRGMFSKTFLIITLARTSNDFFTASFLRMIHESRDPLTRLFVSAMSRGNAAVAMPYSLFAPRAVVLDLCSRWQPGADDHVTLLALRYMTVVRSTRGDDERDVARDDRYSFLEDQEGEYWCRKAVWNFRRFRRETFFANEPTTLILRSLEIMIRYCGLDDTLCCFQNDRCTVNMPSDTFDILHRYYAFTVWNFVEAWTSMDEA